MFNNHNAIQCMGILMTKEAIDLNTILELVEILNSNYFQCQRVVTILSDVFDREKSGKILHGVNVNMIISQVLEYLIKNANKKAVKPSDPLFIIGSIMDSNICSLWNAACKWKRKQPPSESEKEPREQSCMEGELPVYLR